MASKSALLAKAVRTGKSEANKVLSRRRTALGKRRAALNSPQARRDQAKIRSVSPRSLRAAGGAASAGTLVAEGDSWFDYPGADVLSLLEDEQGFDVEAVAHAGDRIEGMAYDNGQLEDFTRLLEKVIRRGTTPRAILLSGGGNDVAGSEFEMLLDHAKSPAPGLNQKVVDGILNQRVLLSYATVLSAVTTICKEQLGQAVRIVIHGYDHPVPDGRGFLGGWGLLPGPWLEPGFRKKGFGELPRRTAIARDLIDQFNTAVKSLMARPGFSHVRYVDLRRSLSTGPDYKRWWSNELHPTNAGFSIVARRFADAVRAT